MKNIKGNLWEQRADAICITTNGFVKSNGECVMGKGCALQATKMVPNLAHVLGTLLMEHGNRPFRLCKHNGADLVTYPVKPVSALADDTNVVTHKRKDYRVGEVVPGWACKARPDIIVQSARELVRMADKFGWERIVLPRPGCGAGELQWSDILPLLDPILDHRFEVITY